MVAEGIESKAQLTELIRLGCDTGQGVSFSPPLTAEAVEGKPKSRETSTRATADFSAPFSWQPGGGVNRAASRHELFTSPGFRTRQRRHESNAR